MKKVAPIIAGLVALAILLSPATVSFGECPVGENAAQETKCDPKPASCCDKDCACEINSVPSREPNEQPAPAPVSPRPIDWKLVASVSSTIIGQLSRLEMNAVASRAASASVAPHQSLYLLDCVFLL